MANEIRRRETFAAGGLSVGLSTVDTTMQSNGLQDLPVLASDEYFPLSLFRTDSLGRITQKEVVYMTAHSAAAGSGTILRAQEGTTAQIWSAGDRWSLTDTALDNIIVCKSTTRPAIKYDGMLLKELDTDYVRFWSGASYRHVANIKMYTCGASLAGGAAPAFPNEVEGAPPMLIQAGTIVIGTNTGGGTGPINFPNPFPNGLLTVFAINGDAGATDNVICSMYNQNASNFEIIAIRSDGTRFASATLRFNWFAIGW